MNSSKNCTPREAQLGCSSLHVTREIISDVNQHHRDALLKFSVANVYIRVPSQSI